MEFARQRQRFGNGPGAAPPDGELSGRNIEQIEYITAL
jgi:hypothetical protein